MEIKEYLDKLVELITQEDSSYSGNRFLGVVSEELVLRYKLENKDDFTLICIITKFDIVFGLKISEWDKIARTISELKKKGKLT